MNGTKLNFREWLAQQAEASRREEARLAAIEEWEHDLYALFSELDRWLHEDDDEHILKVSANKVSIHEEELGRYEAETRSIALNGKVVDLIPVARRVVGPIGTRGDLAIRAKGRVDMTNGAERYFLYLAVYPTGTRWVIVDDDTYTVRDLGRDTFEQSLQELLS